MFEAPHTIRLLFLLILIYGGIQPLEGADHPRILHFVQQQYQAANQNWSISQDEQGILLFGNGKGLLEFDGLNWSVHPLSGGQVVRATATGSDRIYVGGYAEFGYWTRDALGRMAYTSLSSQLPPGMIGKEEIWHILVSSQGVFFQSFGSVYHYDQGHLERLTLPGNIMFLYAWNDRIVVPVIESGIYEWKGNGQFEKIPGSAVFADKAMVSLFSGPDGLLVGTRQNGIYQYDGQRFTTWEHPVKESLITSQLNKAIRLHDGKWALGTILDGVYIIDEKSIVHHLNQENGLQNNTVLALYEDRQKNLWLGLDKGIDLLTLSSPLRFLNDRQVQIGAVYTAAVHKDLLFIGTNQGVYYRSWPFQVEEDFQFLNGTQGQVWQLANFGGRLLCGHNEGTFEIEGKRIRPVSNMTGGWYTIALPGDSSHLLQGTYTGIAVLQKKRDGAWAYSHRVEGMGEPIKKLHLDREGILWVVNPNEAVYRMKLSEDLHQILDIDTINTTNGLPSNLNLDLLVYEGKVLIWSQGSYFSWDNTQHSCRPFEFASYLEPPEQHFWKLISGRPGDLFAIFPRHVILQRAREKSVHLPIQLITHFENIIYLPDQSYLFCLDNGYAYWPAKDSFPTNEDIEPIIKTILPARYSDFLGNIRGPSTLVFPAKTNKLQFVFSAPFYTEQPILRSRLLGFEQEWSSWQTLGVKEFTNLPSGKYELEVQNILNTSVARLVFSIARPWYQSPWLYLVYFLGFLGLLWSLYRWHHYRLAVQHRRLVLEKDRQLQQHRIQAKNEQLQSDLIGKSTDLANSTFNLIRKNETLVEVKEALYKAKSELGDRIAGKYYQQMIRLIEQHLSDEQDWKLFETNFNQVHEVFFKHLKVDYPDLTPGDLRLAAYLKMNLSSKEIAPLLNISLRGVENKRYRLRSKLHLDSDKNLVSFLMNY